MLLVVQINFFSVFSCFFKLNKPRTFSECQKTRLKSLGIDENIDPDDLTPEQIRAFSRLDIDCKQVEWNRVMDTNDRFLREITVGEGAEEKGFTRKVCFFFPFTSFICFNFNFN